MGVNTHKNLFQNTNNAIKEELNYIEESNGIETPEISTSVLEVPNTILDSPDDRYLNQNR